MGESDGIEICGREGSGSGVVVFRGTDEVSE
jgi:hypothetical protein